MCINGAGAPVAASSAAGGRGFTLIEVIMAIVIISAALAGVLLVINQNTANSVDPVLITQSRSIAQSYLEEILLQG